LEAQARSSNVSHNGQTGWLLSATDAQIGQIYWRLFRIGSEVPSGMAAVSEPMIAKPQDIVVGADVTNLHVVGSGAALREQFPTQFQDMACEWLPDVRPHADVIAQHVLTAPDTFAAVAAEQLTPRYVQQDIGWKKLSEQPRRD
jgi:tRNA threonylcarbamoyladenosine biosynthesis protein TsaB